MNLVSQGNLLNLRRKSRKVNLSLSVPKMASPHPQIPIKAPVLDRFTHMLRLDPLVSCKVGDGPRHLQDAIISTS
jgi:hypothetical protein